MFGLTRGSIRRGQELAKLLDTIVLEVPYAYVLTNGADNKWT